MKKIIFIVLLFIALLVQAQVEAGQLIVIHEGTTAQINATTTASVGSLAYDNELKTIKYFDGTKWVDIKKNVDIIKIEAGTNITVEGNGKELTPYKISANKLELIDNSNGSLTFSGGGLIAPITFTGVVVP